MANKFGFGEHLEIILREMCTRVGADFDTTDFKRPEWYWEHEWSKEDETEFSDWLRDYLYDNLEARRELLNHTTKNKKHAADAAAEFVWMYGWKVRSDEVEDCQE